MKHFFIDEGGSSALLATAIDPTCGKTRNRGEFIRLFTNRISRNTDIELPEKGPKKCVREHWGIDLVCSWGKWLVLIENKVRASSVRPGQLQQYYKTGQDIIMKDAIGRGTQHILMVYLTPGRLVGKQEFDGLNVLPGDAKVHLCWKDILRDLNKAYGKSKEPVIPLAISHMKKLVAEGKKKERFERTPNRIAMAHELALIRNKVEQMLAREMHLWRDEFVDQIYGNLEGKNGNVYLDILSDGTDLTGDGNGILQFRIKFWIANKAPSSTKLGFAQHTAVDWARMLGVSQNQIDSSEISRGRVSMSGKRIGPPGSWTDEMAELYCRFMMVFKPYMADKDDAGAS